jgi:glycosyltransferase involved in cell wall biosynthesis
VSLRVLILNWKDMKHPQAGGAEVYVERVAARLVALGHDVTLFAAAVEGLPERDEGDGYAIVRRGGRFGVYSQARGFWRSEGDGRFDVVIDQCNTRPFLTPRYVRSAAIVGLFYQVAREVWRYEMPFPIAVAGRYVFEPWWLRSYRRVPVMTISASSAQSLHDYGVEHTVILPIGHDPAEPVDEPKADKPTVVFLGRLSANKRPDHAIEAFELLRRSHPDAQMWIMGDGPMRSELDQRSAAGVELLGRVPIAERQRRLAASHVLVATSVREGWGLNVSEAAAVGTPTIGYAVDGLRDSIPASGGHLVHPDPESLAAGLAEFFGGTLQLDPRPSTVDWADVGDAVEHVLVDSYERFRTRAQS